MLEKQWNLHQSTFQLPRSFHQSITAARDDHFCSIQNCWNVKKTSRKCREIVILVKWYFALFLYYFSFLCARLDGNSIPLQQLICCFASLAKVAQFKLEILRYFMHFIHSRLHAREKKINKLEETAKLSKSNSPDGILEFIHRLLRRTRVCAEFF